MELSEDHKEQLVRLTKLVVVPALGYLVTRNLYVHRDKITGYIQYHPKPKGFIVGLARGTEVVISQFSGRFLDNGDIEVEKSTMDDEAIETAESLLSSAEVHGIINE